MDDPTAPPIVTKDDILNVINNVLEFLEEENYIPAEEHLLELRDLLED